MLALHRELAAGKEIIAAAPSDFPIGDTAIDLSSRFEQIRTYLRSSYSTPRGVANPNLRAKN